MFDFTVKLPDVNEMYAVCGAVCKYRFSMESIDLMQNTHTQQSIEFRSKQTQTAAHSNCFLLTFAWTRFLS